LTSHPLLSLLLPPPPRSTLFPYTTLVRSPDEARRRCGRGDRVNRLDAALEPRVTGLHDAPVPSGNADLELAGDQAADAAALVTVRQRLAAGSEVDAVATHQVLTGLVEGEQGRVEQATGDVCGGG